MSGSIFQRARRLLSGPDRRFRSEDFPGPFAPAFAAWLARLEEGSLLAGAPCEPPSLNPPFLASPLHYWLGRAQPPEAPESLEVFLDALPRLARLGLPIDLAAPSEGLERFDTLSKRPISHLALAPDWRSHMPLWFLEGLLDHGADPNAPDAYGLPLLALCSLSADEAFAIDAWELLTSRGADPAAPIPNTHGKGAGVAASYSFHVFHAAGDPDFLTPLDFARLSSETPFAYPAIAAIEARRGLEHTLPPAAPAHAPRRL